MHRIGHYKDVAATIFFALTFVIGYYIQDINQYKQLILTAIFLGAILDGTFSLSPNYHNAPVGQNIPTYVTVFGLTSLALVILVSVYHRLSIRGTLV